MLCYCATMLSLYDWREGHGGEGFLSGGWLRSSGGGGLQPTIGKQDILISTTIPRPLTKASQALRTRLPSVREAPGSGQNGAPPLRVEEEQLE